MTAGVVSDRKKTTRKVKIKKRDGREVDFEAAKITGAVRRCFVNNLKVPHSLADRLASGVTEAVSNIVLHHKGELGVEDIQRYVIQQLWALGHFDAAEHYQNYRQERSRLRKEAPIDQETTKLVTEDQKHFPTDLQYYQFISKFSRWDYSSNRRETWKETCFNRVLPWLFKQPLVKDKLSEQDKSELSDAMYHLEASPAMRVVQMAGPALDRCNVGAYNCANTPLDDFKSFAELLYVLMQGTGCSFSVEDEYVSKLPRIKKQNGNSGAIITPEDSTEGWCDCLLQTLELLFDGYDVQVDPINIRPANAVLKTKGGRASGPGPLLELINFARSLILSKQGRFLDDLDVHDLGCMIGRIVQVGGVRRAACLSHSDLLSVKMRDAKSGNWYGAHPQRTMANNSAVYEEKPSIEIFMEEWLALVKSKSGERGIFNRAGIEAHKPTRRKSARWLTNPCGEILFPPRSFCNLSIAIATFQDTIQTLKNKVRVATLFGLIQSTCTKFGYLRDEWRLNCEDERLLGVDITGHADCPLLRYGALGRVQLLRELLVVVRETKAIYAPRFGINPSAADTCIKPGGDSAVFFNCASGVSPWFSDYQMRYVRERKDSPVAHFLKDSGVPFAPAPEAPGELMVFGFPREAPLGATKRNDLTAKQQFFNWLEWKQNWAEHSVSATIYVEEHEWLELGALVYQHFDEITGLSFLPKDNGIYQYPPNQELSKEEYDKVVKDFPQLNWAKLSRYESEDFTEGSKALACTSGACDI